MEKRRRFVGGATDNRNFGDIYPVMHHLISASFSKIYENSAKIQGVNGAKKIPFFKKTRDFSIEDARRDTPIKFVGRRVRPPPSPPP